MADLSGVFTIEDNGGDMHADYTPKVLDICLGFEDQQIKKRKRNRRGNPIGQIIKKY